MEKQELFMPAEWWAKIIPSLDEKIKIMATGPKFGKITFEIVVSKGRVRDLVFTDEVRIRNDFEDVKEKTKLTPTPKV